MSQAEASPRRGVLRALIEDAWRRARRRRFAVVAVLAVCAAVGASLYFFLGGGGSHGGAPPSVHGSASQSQRALNTIAARYGGSAIVSTRIGGPPPHYAYVSREKPVPRKFKVAKWAYITVRAPCNCGRANRAIWEATVVGAALRDDLRARHQYLYAAPVTLLLPDGRKVKTGTGCCGVAEITRFASRSSREIRSTIRRAAHGTGLHIDSIAVLRPEQAAPAVVATTRKSRQSIVNESDDLTRRFFFLPTRKYHRARPAYEGYYLEVRRPNGKPFLILTTSFRSGSGGIWAPMNLLCGPNSHANVSCPTHEGGRPSFCRRVSPFTRDRFGEKRVGLWRRHGSRLLEVIAGETQFTGSRRAVIHLSGEVARLMIRANAQFYGKVRISGLSCATRARVWFTSPSAPGWPGTVRGDRSRYLTIRGRGPYKTDFWPIIPRSGDYVFFAVRRRQGEVGVIVIDFERSHDG